MSVWATIDKPESVNFADILSEEKSRNLQTKKENPVWRVVKNQDQTVVDVNITAKEVGAKADDTFNSDVGNQEQKYLEDASEKLQVHLLLGSNQKGVLLNDDLESDIREYEIEDIQDRENYDVPHPLEKELISAASYSYKLRNSGKGIIKCDVILNEKKNTDKETANLVPLFKGRIPCPEIVKLKDNVFMKSSIGESCKPILKLKYATLSYPDFVSAYKQVKSIMRKLYEKAHLIHGNLTENNILWHDGKCYFIDSDQFIKPGHEIGFYFLQSDCDNITRFFGKKIEGVDTPEELFQFITGFHFGNKIVLEHMKNLYRIKPRCHHKAEVESLMASILHPRKSQKVNYQRKIN